MARTPQSTRTCTMRSSEHAAHRLLMHSVHTSHLWLKVSPCVSFHVIHACAPVCCSLSVSPHPSFYFLVLFLFQLYLMSNSAPDEFSIEDPLCNSSLGSMVTLVGSVSKIVANGNKVVFVGSGSFRENKRSREILWMREDNGVYVLDV